MYKRQVCIRRDGTDTDVGRKVEKKREQPDIYYKSVSYTHLDVYKRQVHPCTSVVMYRSDFKHTLSCSVDSFGMYMYDGLLKLWIYYTYIY